MIETTTAGADQMTCIADTAAPYTCQCQDCVAYYDAEAQAEQAAEAAIERYYEDSYAWGDGSYREGL
jgi:hypothetical protein